MRRKLSEGEWIAALDKAISMINSCEEQKKSRRSERIVLNYMENLFKMTPFDPDLARKQIKIKLETETKLWLDHMGRIVHLTRSDYGRLK